MWGLGLTRRSRTSMVRSVISEMDQDRLVKIFSKTRY
jgi:hypothetical protein